ncbi:MAG: UpxY family transcription antiterminator, partial [Dysgonomonadaceae bacterium]|nr:UpxY family transcription antiterminator [Dysgonamonadaceae bacterium]
MAEDFKDSNNRRWLAAYVKMHHEKKVRDRLTELGIENFLPVQKEVRQWSDRRKKIERVLIPMMIFVYVNPDEQRTVITLPSVLRYMVLRGEHTPT